jgi:hypothetical protein
LCLDLFEETVGEGGAVAVLRDFCFFRWHGFGDGGQRAAGGVEFDLFDQVEGCLGRGCVRLSREVGGGDLGGIEEEARAASVDLVGGNAAGDFGDG